MRAGDLNISLILKLVDQFTGPSRAATSAIRSIGTATQQQGRAGVAWADRQIAANRARSVALQGEALGLAAIGAGLYALTEPAIQAEKLMAEVSKVVDFNNPEGFSLLQRDIQDLVTSGGLAQTAEGVTDIVAAGARMGVVNANLPDAEKRKALLEFATSASKMAVAFGISADEAGTTLARWRQNLSLSQTEAMALGDTVNFLGNTMATNEGDILRVINRQGVVAKTSGLAAKEIAALSATLLAAGASPEVAATGMKNFANALTRGESVTKRQAKVFRTLGFDAELFAMRMQTDATGAITDLLDEFQNIEPYRRSSLVGDLFGEEAKGAIMPLIENTQMLKDAFAQTADQTKLLGLMEKEYNSQAATTYTQRQRLLEYFKVSATVIGTSLLPILNDLMATLFPIIAQFSDWAAAHPELISLIFKVVLGLFAFRVASLALRFVLYTLITPFFHIIRACSKLLIFLPTIARGLAFLLTPMKLLLRSVLLLSKAFIRLGLIMLTNPVGLIIAGIAALAYVVYENWDHIVSYFTEKLDVIRTAFDQGLIHGVFAILSELNPFTLMIDGIVGLTDYVMGLLGVPDEIREAFTSFSLTETGVALIKTLWDGIYAASPKAIQNIIDTLSSITPNWDGMVNYFNEKIAAISSAFDDGLINGVLKIIAELNPFTLMIDGMQSLIAYVMELLGVPEEIVAAFKEFSLWDTGVQMIQSLWDGMKSLVPKMVASVKESITGMIPEWMQNPSSLWGGGSDPASSEAGRDGGGPVRAGMPYIVGEREPELFIPGVSGSILPTRALKAAMAASVIAAPVAGMAAGQNIATITPSAPIARAAPTPQINRAGDTYTININAPVGADAAEIARLVRVELDKRSDVRRGDLHDGVDYE